MTRKGLVEVLLDNKIEYITIVQNPDYCGGHKFSVLFNLTADEAEEFVRDEPFTYVAWHGDASDAARHHHMLFYEHVERFHEPPVDYPVGLDELVLNQLSWNQYYEEAMAGTLEPAM